MPPRVVVQTIVEDVAFVRQQMEVVHPGEKPFVGGLSLGSIAAVATINAHPGDYAGAILIEGTLYDENTQVRNINTSFCAAFDDQSTSDQIMVMSTMFSQTIT